MALCRCKVHAPNGHTYNYSHFVKPIGFPNTSSICGISGANWCENPGLIFLADNDDGNNSEVHRFNDGERIFYYFRSNETKVKVEDKIYPISEIEKEA